MSFIENKKLTGIIIGLVGLAIAIIGSLLLFAGFDVLGGAAFIAGWIFGLVGVIVHFLILFTNIGNKRQSDIENKSD